MFKVERRGRPYRLDSRVVEHARVDIVGLALNLICPAAIVPYGANDGTNVAARHVDRLAIVKRLDSGQEICVLLEKVGKL